MAAIQLPNSSGDSIFVTFPQFQIATKKQWTDEWKNLDYLELLGFSVSVAPTMSKATMRWRTGKIKQEDQTKFSTVKPQDLKNQFVRIQLIPPKGNDQNQPNNNNAPKPTTVWVGVIVEETDDIGGLDATGDDQVATTDQNFVAYGLEYLLKKTPIYGSFITNDGSTSDYIDTGLVFNERFTHGPTAIGNRSAAKITPGNENPKCYHFAKADPANPANSVWAAYDILEYLLSVYPVDENVQFTLGGQATAALGKLQLPRVNLEGKNVYEALNSLIDRRRGLGWCVRTDAKTDAPTVHIFTVFDQVITTSDGDTIPANAEQNPLDLSARSDDISIESLNVGDDATGAVGNIYVEGERIITAFTLSVADGNLEKAWTDAQETTYCQGANVSNSVDGYKQKNDAARALEGLSNVYTTFRVPNAWDWTAGNGRGGSKSAANPGVKQDGSLDTGNPATARAWGMKFLRHLPWQKSPGSADSIPDFEAPMAFIKYQGTADSSGAVPSPQWVLLHKLVPFAPPAHLLVLENDFGIKLEISGDYLAKAPITTLSPGEATPAYDWHDLMVTAAVRTDATVNAWDSIDGENRNQGIYIRVPGAELWYVLPNTVYDVDASGKPKSFAGKPANAIQGLLAAFDPTASLNLIIRDDSSRLRRLLAMAKGWYSKSRRPFEMHTRKFVQNYPVGSYISSIKTGDSDGSGGGGSQTDVNCVVTQIEWDHESGVTKISGSFSEMDFAGEREDLPNLEN